MASVPASYIPQVTIIRSIGTLTFDAVLAENHQSQLEVTSNPIETGVTIQDHCFMQPLRCTVNAVVSDLKMPTGTNLYDDSSGMRARRAFEMLQKLQTDCADGLLEPFDVSTGLRLYKRMICTSISATQDAETAQLLAFEAQLQQIIIASTQQTTYAELPKPRAGKTQRQATPPKEDGNQQPKTMDEQMKSMAASIGDTIASAGKAAKGAVKGFFGK